MHGREIQIHVKIEIGNKNAAYKLDDLSNNKIFEKLWSTNDHNHWEAFCLRFW